MTPLLHLVEILNNISTRFTLVTGNEGHLAYKGEHRFIVHSVNYKIDNSVWKVARYLYGQVKASILLIKISRGVDFWFFFGGQRSVVPIIAAKLLNKKVIIVMAGSAIRDSSFSQDNFLEVIKMLSSTCLSLADKIVIYSPNLIPEWTLSPIATKLSSPTATS